MNESFVHYKQSGLRPVSAYLPRTEPRVDRGGGWCGLMERGATSNKGCLRAKAGPSLMPGYGSRITFLVHLDAGSRMRCIVLVPLLKTKLLPLTLCTLT